MLGDVEDGVEAEQVGEEERAHRRQLGAGDRLVDRLQREPLLLLGAPDLPHRRHQDSVDDEAGDLAADDRLLLDRLGEVVGGGRGFLRGVLADDHLDQRHDRGRVEEVEADDLVGPQRRLPDLGDRERGGVGGEDRVARGGRVDLAEDRLLDLHLLRHRLDHEVDVAELLVAGGADHVPHHLGEPRVGLLLGQLLLLDQAGELALGDAAGFLEGGVDELLVDVLDDDGDVGGGDRLRDLPAHGAAADDGGLGDEHWLRFPPVFGLWSGAGRGNRRLYRCLRLPLVGLEGGLRLPLLDLFLARLPPPAGTAGRRRRRPAAAGRGRRRRAPGRSLPARRGRRSRPWRSRPPAGPGRRGGLSASAAPCPRRPRRARSPSRRPRARPGRSRGLRRRRCRRSRR